MNRRDFMGTAASAVAVAAVGAPAKALQSPVGFVPALNCWVGIDLGCRRDGVTFSTFKDGTWRFHNSLEDDDG